MTKRILHVLCFIFISVCLSAHAGEIWVSPSGNDTSDGTQTHPFATLNQALRQAREWRRLGMSNKCAGGIHIIMTEGIYPLYEPLLIRPEDSGTSLSPTIIESAPGADVTISGGATLKFRHCASKIAGLATKAKGKIWMTDVPDYGSGKLTIRQLWINGNRAQRASQFAADSLCRILNFDKTRQTITIPNPHINLSADAIRNLEMLVHQRWAIAILRVSSITEKGDSAVVRFRQPESRLEFEHPWPQPVIGGDKGNSSFCLINALQLLDTLGEWYQDATTGKTYYWPREDEDMTNADIVAPCLNRLVNISGTDNRKVCNITFRNIRFKYTSWLRPSLKGHVTLQAGFPIIDAYKLQKPGLPEKAELENQAWVERPDAAISIESAEYVNFDHCEFANIGATAIDYHKSVSNSMISHCTFGDIGGTAIMGGTFPDGGFETHVPYIPADSTEVCRNIKISNNMIKYASAEDWGCPAISLGYVSDTRIEHNEVAYCNYSGICVGWGWTPKITCMRNNIIEANYVHHFAMQLYDAGGIYTLSNQPSSAIIDNRIEAIGDAPYATNDRGFYIYLDEATDGYSISNNWTPDTKRYGDNRPGPTVKWKGNGPDVDQAIKKAAGIRK